MLPVFGTIHRRAGLMEQSSGGTSTEGIKQAFNAAVADPGIGSIVLQIDSPGGQTAGLEELATAIQDAREVKPIVAVADSMMASAAYRIGAAATEVFATPSSTIGSIGTMMIHLDRSEEMGEGGREGDHRPGW